MAAAATRRPDPVIAPLVSARPALVDDLLDRAFEPARRTRTAYLVRGNAAAIAELSFAAWQADTLIGTIQCWPVALRPDAGGARLPLVMVGPVAVSPDHQRHGVGRLLMTAALAAAAVDDGDRALTLIGDPEYYGRFFGFDAAATTRWRLPGPVERRRLLARGAAVPDLAGALGPWRDDAS